MATVTMVSEPVVREKGENGEIKIKGSKAKPGGLHRRRSSSTSMSRSQYCLVLVLVPLNGTFEKKSLVVPFAPDMLKLGRQTNNKTVPTPENGYFDSRVLSRQHAEIWADSAGKLWIKDSKSSNGTYINNERLSSDNTESTPHELKKGDTLELGIDISNDDGSSLMHRKISARVERISIMGLNANGNGGAPQPNGSISSKAPQKKGFGTARPDALDVALFGDVEASLEDLIMNHARNSMGGMFVNSGVASSGFDSTVKRLIGEIHAAKVEGAKLKSVSKVLEQIKKAQSKQPVLTSLANDLAAKDARIVELESQLKQKEEESEKNKAATDSEKRLQTVLTELAETKCQMEIYQSRAKNAEEMAMKSSKTIAELVQALEESKRSQQQQQQLEELPEKEIPTPPNFEESSIRPTARRVQEPSVHIVPLTAVGVVLVGVGFMALFNQYRD